MNMPAFFILNKTAGPYTCVVAAFAYGRFCGIIRRRSLSTPLFHTLIGGIEFAADRIYGSIGTRVSISAQA